MTDSILNELEESERLGAAIKTVMEGFQSGIFVRSTEGDGQADWAFKMIPYVGALAQLDAAPEAIARWREAFARQAEELRLLREERDAFKMLAEGQERLLVAYRLGRRTADGALNVCERAKKKLEAISALRARQQKGDLSDD